MGYLNGGTFVFNGVSSELYNIIVCWTNPDSEDVVVEREIVKGDTNLVRHMANQYGAQYSNVLELDFCLFHGCGGDDVFTEDESRTINNWLCTDTYRPLKFNDNNTENIYYKAICKSISDITFNGRNAKHVVFECDSTFAYTESRRKRYDVKGQTHFTFFNNSDAGIYYPTFIIQTDESYDAEIEIKNETENRTMSFDFAGVEAVDGIKKLTVNSYMNAIYNTRGFPIPFYKLGFKIIPDDNKALQSMDIYWLRLLPGLNSITVKGTCIFEFNYSFPRKVGVL